MFDNIFAAIEKWMRELLTGMVESNMSTMFTDVNEKTSEIAAQVGRTPQNWNSSVFSMIQNLSESVVVPIAGIIITLVLCYELISMLTERNNLHDVDIEKAFSHGNPWLMKFRAISIPEKLERTHLKEWLDHVWIVDFEQVEVILQESEWKRFFPEEWLNNGEEDCNGKKE